MNKRKVLCDAINGKEIAFRTVPYFKFCFSIPSDILSLMSGGYSIPEIEDKLNIKMFGFEDVDETNLKNDFSISNLIGVIVGSRFHDEDEVSKSPFNLISFNAIPQDFYLHAYTYYESQIKKQSNHKFIRRKNSQGIEHLNPMIGASTYLIN